MRMYTIRVFNETALPNSDFVGGLKALEADLMKLPLPTDLYVSVELAPKRGKLPDNLMGTRGKGMRFLCLVNDASRAVELADKFGLRLREDEKRHVFDDTVYGMAPPHRPVFFLWNFEVNRQKRNPHSFSERLRGSCLHEMGHSLGLWHSQDAEHKDRKEALDVMVRQPDVKDPKLHYVAADAKHVAKVVTMFVNWDPGGFRYGAL